MKRRTTMQVFNAALRGETTSGEAARELTAYREATLVSPRTRWGLTWFAPDASERRWVVALCIPGLLSGVLLRVLGELWGALAAVAALTVAWGLAGLRLVRVPVKIPSSNSLGAVLSYYNAVCECRRVAGDCECERCGHGRLACERCDECGRREFVL